MAGGVEGVRVGERTVGLLARFGVEAEPPVVDLQHEPAADRPRAQGDLGVRRREHRGVLQQFGDEVDDVGDRVRRDAGLRHRRHHHARVVLDLADGRGDDVRERHGPAPAPAGRGAGEDDQALRVPAHTRGEVVDAEQLAQHIGVVRAPFQGVDQLQLPVDEGLVAPCDVEQHREQTAAQARLSDGGVDGGEPRGVEGTADLSDLVVADLVGGQRRRLGERVHLLAGAQSAHDVRELVSGQDVGRVPQGLQAP